MARAATAKPRINFGDFSGLKELGVSAKSIETLKNAASIGGRFSNRADLVKAGIPEDEVDLIASSASLSTTPDAKPVTVEISTAPARLVGYFLGILRDVTGAGSPEESLVPIPPTGRVSYTYDDATTGPLFTVFAKSPGGDLLDLTVGNETARQHSVKKEALGEKAFTLAPAAEIRNAKSVAAVAEPALPPTRIKGRLLSVNPKGKIDNVQIIIEVATQPDPQDAAFAPVCFAETETNGYFVTSQVLFHSYDDFRNLTAARAKVAATPAVTLPIRLDSVSEGRGRLPERLILYFDAPAPAAKDKDDCACGDCTDLNFHDKKVLDEFSYFTVVRTTEPLIEAYQIEETDEIELDDLLNDIRDPDIRGLLSGIKVNRNVMVSFLSRNTTITKANVSTLVNNIETDRLRRRVLQVPKPKRGRVELNGQEEIDWDEKPKVYQAVSVAHGHLLHFKQEWFNDGYSIGDLLYSLPLAPGQKKQIVVFDWDRKESAANVQQLDYQESLYNSLSRDRDVNEVARATLNENVRGSSEASAGGFGAGLGIGAIIPVEIPIGGLLGVGGGFGSGSSSARQSASRTTTASSQQHISDRTVQAANSVRSQRSTVIQTVSQGERFQVSAESVANYNHCHAMTIQYFEVLRHFEVRTRLADAQECLFVPLKMSAFTPKKALRWRDILQRCLRKRHLVRGFDALYRIEEERESSTENYYDRIGLPDSFADEELNYVEGEIFVEFQLTRPRNDDADSFLAANWTLWAALLGDPLEFYNRLIKHESRRDDAFARHAGPVIAQAIFDEIRFHAVKNGTSIVSHRLPIDATLLSDFRNRSRLNVSLRMSGPILGIKRSDVDYVKISLDGATGRSAVLRDLTNDRSLRIIIHSGAMRYRTRNLHEHLFQSSSIKNDLSLDGDDVRVFCPLSERALRRPRLEDVEVSNDLLHHLNENLEYYHQCMWSHMDDQRRFILLDGVLAPGRANGRSVASVVENRLIGIVGNCIVMPVAPGFKLDPVLDETVDLYEHYYEEPRDPMHLSMPTKGVFAEAVMGRCNSCEKKEEDRFWRWEESPIPDSPTAIQAIGTPVPQPSQPNLAIHDFPAPIINLQNAPALPDPQGFGALTTLLSRPDVFRDLTGLSENQKNALAAFQSSLKTAETFGKEAAELTKSASAMKLIQDAQKQGLIDNEKAKEKTEKVIDTALPASNNEKIAAAKKQVEMIDDIEKQGGLSGQSAQNARSRIIESLANEISGTNTTSTEDLGKLIEKASAFGTDIRKDAASFEIKNDGTTRPLIIEDGVTPAARAFGSSTDFTGKTKLRVRGKDLPAGATLRWSIPSSEAGKYTIAQPMTSGTSEVEISGMQPGLTGIYAEALDGGTVVARIQFPLSIPQFMTVDDTNASLDKFMSDHAFENIQDAILVEARATVDLLLVSEANVRLLWKSKGGSVPAHVPARFVVQVAILDSDPSQNYGEAVAGPMSSGQVGDAVFDERVNVFPASFLGAGVRPDVDSLTNDLVRIITEMKASDPAVEIWVIRFLGRLIGGTIAHEVYHTLLPVPFLHNVDTDGNNVDTADLMDQGNMRSFRERTGIDALNALPADFLDHLTDNGMGAMSKLTGVNLAHIRSHFPTPPTPPFDR